MQNIVFLSGEVKPLHLAADDRRFWPVVFDSTKVSGVLDGNARAEIKTDGNAAVHVVIKQPGGLPIVVERCYGHGAEALAEAVATASEMVHGRRVRAVGHQLALNWSLPTLSLELIACTGLDLQPVREVRQ